MLNNGLSNITYINRARTNAVSPNGFIVKNECTERVLSLRAKQRSLLEK